VTEVGAWKIGEQIQKLVFYKNGFVFVQAGTVQGTGQWSISSDNQIRLDVCRKIFTINFSGADPIKACHVAGENEGSFQASECAHEATMKALLPNRASRSTGPPLPVIISFAGTPFESEWDEGDVSSLPNVVKDLMGSGPWSWGGVMPLGFFRGGHLSTLWGDGKWGPVKDEATGGWSEDTIYMNFVGQKHIVKILPCHQFLSTRASDGEETKGWMQIPDKNPLEAHCPL